MPRLKLHCVDTQGIRATIYSDEVCFIDLLKKKKIQFHTYSGTYTYRFEGTLETCLEVFGDYGFEDLDSGNVVNLGKITHVDNDLRIVYFGPHIQTTVSRRNLHKLKDINT